MNTTSPETNQPVPILRFFAHVERGEVARVTWAFLFFFTLLGGYFMLRPVREAVAVANGVENIPWLFTATLGVMLLLTPIYGWVVARFPRRVFLPVVYIFFIANLLTFYFLFEFQVAPQIITRVFFVWLSVFNLFVVSVFWSFMVDIYNSSQARRLFGLIAAGGSLGAIFGPLLTATLADLIGVPNLLLGATLMIIMATVSIFILRRHSREEDPAQQVEDREVMGGNVLEGALRVFSSRYLLMICGLMLLHNMSATFLYNLRAHAVAAATDDFIRYTEIFGWVDFSVNIIALLLQALITIRLVRRFGMSKTLMAIPLLLLIGFAGIGLMPGLLLIIIVQVFQRSMNYGILGPAKEMLFAPVDREIKYKSKNFIDTVIYRGSDSVSAWIFRALHSGGLNLSLSAIAWLLLPFLALWTWLVWRLGHQYQALHEASLDLEHTSILELSGTPEPGTDKAG